MYNSDPPGVENRLLVMHNGIAQISFIAANTQGNRDHCQTYTATGVRNMAEGDWFSYRNLVWKTHAYHAHAHTQLTVVFLG